MFSVKADWNLDTPDVTKNHDLKLTIVKRQMSLDFAFGE